MNSTDIERALASLCIDHGIITAETAARLLRDARNSARPLATMIAESVDETALLAAVAKELRLRFVDLNSPDVGLMADPRLLARVDMNLLGAKAAMPMVNREGAVVVVMANPLDSDTVTYLRSRFPQGLALALAPRSQVQAKVLTATSARDDDIEISTTSVREWVDRVLARSVAERASDLHFRFMDGGQLLVRMRVDGVLRQVKFPDGLKGRESEVIGTVLVKCPTIDPSNTKEPADGTFSFMAGGRAVDARVGMIPQINGANVTVRILDSETLRKRPEDMGFNPIHLVQMRRAVHASQGCVLVVGPTGSGKTTTIYSMLREIDAVSRNVMTVEDPVEYRLPYIGQTQIRADLGDRSLTWGRALRAILRNDPDVVLVGEVRDSEVARVAMEAAITGHLCVTSVHAHSAPGAYARLVQMGVPSFLVADAITIVLSQRLVRQVHTCAQMVAPNEEDIRILSRWDITPPDRVAQPVGCSECEGTGYKGRRAIAEVLVPNPALQALVGAGSSAEELYEAALESGWEPISVDAARHLRAGLTSVAELARVLVDTSAVADDTEEGSDG